MSSRHQDRLLVEGSEPVTGTAAALPTARGTSRRVVGSTEKKATSKVPTQRLGTAQRTGTTQSTAATPAAPRAKRAAGAKAAAATGALASRATSATVKAATARAATAKAATVKAATAKAATAKAATAKAATAARAAAVTTVANHTAGVRSARAAAAAKAAPAAKTRATKSAAAKPTPAVKAPVAKAPVAKAAVKAVPAAKPVAAKSPVADAPAAKAPAAKAPAAKAATAKAAPAKADPAKAALAKTAVARAPVAEVGAAKPARAKATSSGEVPAHSAPRVRPTPHKRVPAAHALAESVALTDVAHLGAPDTTDVVVVRKDAPADADPTAAGRLPLFVRRRLPLARRRPALYLAAALVGAISLSSVSAEEPTAQATTTMSQSHSVAEQLGIEATPPAAVVEADATEQLGELAASRATREAEQDAAMQVQAEADRVAVEAAAEAARPDAVLPIQGARLTSTFGARWGTLHAGIDLAAPMHTPEYAAMDGVVLEAGPASGFGLAVYIQHENGDVTVYGHMDKILVDAGQVVRAGDTIALLGNRGQSTGPHLHFEVHVGGLNGQKIDPLPWLRAAGIDI